MLISPSMTARLEPLGLMGKNKKKRASDALHFIHFANIIKK